MGTIQANAHRGFSEIAPENTLAAFRLALELHPDMLECDVHRTRDGAIVVMHDASVDRTTNGFGRIGEMDLDDIRRLDAGRWFSADFAGEQAPLLEELLGLCRNRSRLMIEVKDDGIEADIVRIVEGARMQDHVIVASFHRSMGARLKSLSPATPFMQLISSATTLSSKEATNLAGTIMAQNASILAINHDAVTPDLMNIMHGRNLQVMVWTVDDLCDMRRLACMGADIITSNRIGLLLNSLAEMGMRRRVTDP